MADDAGNPNRQLAAAWQAATAALGEWRQQVSAATSDAMNKLDPAIRAAVDAGRSAFPESGAHAGASAARPTRMTGVCATAGPC